MTKKELAIKYPPANLLFGRATKIPGCLARYGGTFMCTREKDHTDWHVAHGMDDDEGLIAWKDTGEEIEPED